MPLDLWMVLAVSAVSAAAAGLILKAGHARQILKLRRRIEELEKDQNFTRKQFIKTQAFLDRAIQAILDNAPESLRAALQKVRAGRPPAAIPAHLLDAYTMGGRIPVEERYRDSSYPADKPLVYSREAIEEYMRQIASGDLRGPRYGKSNEWLFQALKKYGVKDKSLAIMGSNRPWYESMCLHLGARCTTIEYNRIQTDFPGLRIVTPAEYDKDPVRFDAALSISSFEHDGLGRFGDPLNPAGDLEAMKKMRSILKTGGLLFLSVPTGKDKIFWNAHRVYGPLRLPLLLDGWQVVERFGYDENDLQKDKNPYEPVFVLKNPS